MFCFCLYFFLFALFSFVFSVFQLISSRLLLFLFCYFCFVLFVFPPHSCSVSKSKHHLGQNKSLIPSLTVIVNTFPRSQPVSLFLLFFLSLSFFLPFIHFSLKKHILKKSGFFFIVSDFQVHLSSKKKSV